MSKMNNSLKLKLQSYNIFEDILSGTIYYSDIFELTSNNNSNNMQKHANIHNSGFGLGLDWPIRNPTYPNLKSG